MLSPGAIGQNPGQRTVCSSTSTLVSQASAFFSTKQNLRSEILLRFLVSYNSLGENGRTAVWKVHTVFEKNTFEVFIICQILLHRY
jgi:hypothetical protein